MPRLIFWTWHALHALHGVRMTEYAGGMCSHLEVGDEVARLRAERAAVDGLPAALQQQQLVEGLRTDRSITGMPDGRAWARVRPSSHCLAACMQARSRQHLEDVDGGLVHGAGDGPPGVHDVAHHAHHDRRRARVQAWPGAHVLCELSTRDTWQPG